MTTFGLPWKLEVEIPSTISKHDGEKFDKLSLVFPKNYRKTNDKRTTAKRMAKPNGRNVLKLQILLPFLNLLRMNTSFSKEGSRSGKFKNFYFGSREKNYKYRVCNESLNAFVQNKHLMNWKLYTNSQNVSKLMIYSHTHMISL